ncbi:MAG: LysR family transcriptional regulator [Sphingomonadales bacterium BRH_c3]|nr:MAG: LysR family transcriptional regulator [Sphingomonadales bacterium BRH_c3]
MTENPTTPQQDWMALVARIFLAALFIIAGLGKLADPAGTIGYIASVGLPLPSVAYGGAAALEVLGGLAVLVGFKTRLAALAIAGFSLVSAGIFHNQLSDQIQFVMFMKNVAIAGGFLLLAAFGPGRYSFDRR